MKRIVWMGLAVVGVLLVVLVALPFFVDLNQHKARWLPMVEGALGRRIEVGNVELTVLTGLGARVEDLVIHEDPTFGSEPTVTMKAAHVRVRLFPLLRGDVVIREVGLEQPAIRVIRDNTGVLNVATLGPAATGKPATQPAPGGGVSTVAALSLVDLSIQDGSLVYIDHSTAGTPTNYTVEDIRAHLGDLAVGETASFDVKARLAELDLPVALSGTAGPLSPNGQPEALDVRAEFGESRIRVTGKTEGADFSLAAASEDLDLDQLLRTARRFAPAIPAEFALSGPGTLALTARFGDQHVALNGRVELDAGRVQYGTWFAKPQGVPLSAAFTGAWRPDRTLILPEITARLHTAEARGSAAVVVGPPLGLRGTLVTQEVDLAGWERLVPVFGDGDVSGRARVEGSFAMDGGRAPTYTGSVTLSDGRLVFRGLPRPIERVQGTVRLSGERLAIQTASAKVGRSDLAVAGSISGFTAPTGALTLSSALVDMGELLPVPTSPKSEGGLSNPPGPSAPRPSGRPSAGSRAPSSASALPAPVQKASIRFTLNAQRVIGPAMPELTNLQGGAVLDHGAIRLDGIKAGLYQGAATLSGRVEPFVARPSFDVDATVDGVQIGSALAQYTSLGDFLVGRVKGRLALSGSGTTWAVLAPALSGRGDVVISDGTIKTVNLVGEALEAAKALGLSGLAERPDTPFQRLAAEIVVRDGALHFSDARLTAGNYTMTLGGTVGLDAAVALRARVLLPPDAAGGLARTTLGAALADEGGRIAIPVVLGGRLPTPTVALDRTKVLDEGGRRLQERAREKLRDFLNPTGKREESSPSDLLKNLLKR